MYEGPLLVATFIGLGAGAYILFQHKKKGVPFMMMQLSLFFSVAVSILSGWIFFSFPGLTPRPAFIPAGIFIMLLPPLAGVFLYLYDRKVRLQQAEHLQQATSQYHLPAIIEDVLSHPEKRAIMEEILKHPERTKIGGQKKQLAIMFTDVRGFTELSEKLDPTDLISFLNEYLNDMSTIILNNHGTVDKYIGDAIMAFWGPPLESPKHVQYAVKTAVEMIEVLKRKRSEWERRGLPDINVGIGINCGEVVVGNLGFEKRFDYTCIGDEVNIASRLEEYSKVYGSTVIISEAVFRVVRNSFVCRELDMVVLPGRKLPVLIYEVLGETVDQKTRAFLHYFSQAFALYRRQQWAAAREAFLKANALRKDKVTTLLIEKCQAHEQQTT